MQRKKIWAKVLMTLLAVLTSVGAWAQFEPLEGDSWNKSTGTLTVNSDPYGYEDCEEIKKVIINNGVTELCDGAFEGCSNLETVEIRSGLKRVGENAFRFCPSLKTITVDAGNTAFKAVDNVLFSKNGKKLLTYPGGKAKGSYTIPSGVTTIAPYAFAGSKVSSLQISSGVTTIEEFAFEECDQLASFTVDAGNTAFKAVDNVLFSKDGETLVAYPGGKTKGSYNIPSSVTTIGFGAFECCQNVTGITFPEGLTSIDGFAFYDCDQLTSVTIGENVKSIGESAFDDCDNLATVNGCAGVEYLGRYVFVDTKWEENLSSATPGVVYVGKVAYKYVGKMPANSEITIKDGTTEIAWYCFGQESNLKSITIPASVKIIDESAFEECTNLATVNGGEGVEHIGKWAFDYTKWWTNQPTGVVYMGKVAYKYVGAMESDAKISLKDGITEISPYCFNGQTDLQSITIPASVTSIGEYAFSSCKGLTSITIPASVTSIGIDAFLWSPNIADVYVLGDAESLTWKDRSLDDFMSGKATKCHVTDQAAFEAKWATGDESDDVNVTFVGDLAVFEDAADNTAAIAALKGETKCVVLNGRTLKGGKWNTLCVPFALTNAMLTDSESPLYGATIREFNDYKNDGTNVTVTFAKWLPMGDKDFDAGFPLLVWIEGEDIVNPVFKDVEIVSEDPQIHDLNDGDKFRGTFKPAYLDEGDTQKLFLQNNTLYYPATASKVNAFRAYFDLKSNVPTTIGGAKTFIDFVDEEATAIEDVTTDNGQQTTDTWYTINGVKLNGEPTEKGVYIYNGHKYIVK